MKEIKKTESIAEFLARGGTINIIAAKGDVAAENLTKTKAGGPATILTYAEGDLFYGDKRHQEKKSKKIAKELKAVRDNFYNLPKQLRDKELKILKAKIEAGEIDEAFQIEDLED